MTIIEKYSKERELNKDKNLVLLGTAVSCFEIDWSAPNTEFWACGAAFGEAHTEIEKIDLGFEIHPLDQMIIIQKERNVNFNKFKCPVFVQNAENPIAKQMIENPVTFPFEDMKQYIKEFNLSNCLTSSFCYMLVYAAMMGYKKVTLYKILLTSDLEYYLERPGLEYWIDRLGHMESIDFYFPEDAELWSRHIFYGYEQRPNLWKIESRKKYHWTMLMKFFKDIESITAMMNKSAGLIEMYTAFKKDIEKDKIEKAIIESKKILEERAPKLKEARDLFMQFAGALQTTNFSEEREY